MNAWQRWVRQPQTVWLRKALFQVHLWSGLGAGLYVFLISITGSVLVYRNEIFRAATPAPIVVTASGERLTEDQLKAAAVRSYRGSTATSVSQPRNPLQAVEVTLMIKGRETRRLFDPYTGRDLGDAVPFALTLAFWLLDLHDNLLAGPTGRAVNGFGALSLIALCLTGAVIWWPGIAKWRQSLWLDWRANWRRLNWTLHSTLGFWFFLIVLIWGVTGAYLCFPGWFNDWADSIEPLTPENAGFRRVDTVLYWLAYLHFGRFGGRIPGCGATCHAAFKFVWATLGLVPPLMFVTGAVMWWNRVLRRRRRATADREVELVAK
jgi:uncharacterized iron-regulated membrane protein